MAVTDPQTSAAFDLLDERIRRYLWLQNWESLREVQERSIPCVVNCDRDVIIAAATAAGKTEAALLPALTHLAARNGDGLIVYVSPLKALINDQFGRLQLLCDHLEIPVWPWHGDVSASVKERFGRERRGVVLITPESLEAMLCRRGSWAGLAFEGLTCVVVDELHAFIGAERGKQLQSLLHRIERLIERTVPRIGLSATLGDMQLAADFLRPGRGRDVTIVEPGASETELRVLVKGYEEKRVEAKPSGPVAIDVSDGDEPPLDDTVEEPIGDAPQWQIAKELFKVLRGSNNLVYPNARREVERYTYFLQRLCEDAQVPNEFWPHHGSLSKSIREETEAALKRGDAPATAICTSTLELGIDIGAVKCVAQVGAPFSVASLRQRLGRSGRRKGEPSVLRGFVIEQELGPRSSLHDELRLETVQFTALVELLIERWFEPPPARGMHLSTLVQQVLACIAQMGGATATELYDLLCGEGRPFTSITRTDFADLLRHLGMIEYLMQGSDGVLLHGRVGEQLVNHYSFYAAFASEEEYRVVSGQRMLGMLPISQIIRVGQRILFAGRTWRVETVDDRDKTIFVVRQPGGAPPMFSGGAGRVHRVVRQRMRDLLADDREPAFLNAVAKQLLAQGRAAYRRLRLADITVLESGNRPLIVTWMGDAGNETLACLLTRVGIDAWPDGPFVEVDREALGKVDLGDLLSDLAIDDLPDPDALLAGASNLAREKWDIALPDALLRRSYASQRLDMQEVRRWLATMASGGPAG